MLAINRDKQTGANRMVFLNLFFIFFIYIFLFNLVFLLYFLCSNSHGLFLTHRILGFTIFTRASFPSRQAAPITAARYPVTSSRDSTSQAAILRAVITIIAFSTLCQSKDSFDKIMPIRL